MKICFKCKKEKPFNQFIKDNSKRDGLRPYCNDCNRILKKASHLKNLITDKGRMKKYYQKNKVVLNEKNKLWAKENPRKIKEISKKYRQRNPEKHRNRRLKHLFGITLIEYNKILHDQNYKCAICKGNNLNNKNFYVDHSHVTGKIRGLLCNLCNSGIGFLKEDIVILEKAINYLKKSHV